MADRSALKNESTERREELAEKVSQTEAPPRELTLEALEERLVPGRAVIGF